LRWNHSAQSPVTFGQTIKILPRALRRARFIFCRETILNVFSFGWSIKRRVFSSQPIGGSWPPRAEYLELPLFQINSRGHSPKCLIVYC
jgi:hypothetical protein